MINKFMKKYKTYFAVPFLALIIIGALKYEAKSQDKWSGTVSWHRKITGTDQGNGPYFSEWRMDATITNDTGTVVQTFVSEHPTSGSCQCTKINHTDLEVGVDEEAYAIFVPAEGCYGTCTDHGVTKEFGVSDETGIAINQQPTGRNPKHLSGTIVIDTTYPDGGHWYEIYTWSLSNQPKLPELIITPRNYDNWLPEPSTDGDESSMGNKIVATFRLQAPGGGKPGLKAKFVELRLSGTSKQKGVTINFPLEPNDPPDPDLRFLEQEDAVLKQEDQYIKITPDDGATGGVEIGSYDGGGWTTLTATATLENGDSVKGHLLVPAGITQIPIPKRNQGSKIGVAWLRANGNPADNDDTEISSGGNTNVGDGLSAYEEYRGVIAQTEFQRLDPKKKELGVRVKWSELDQYFGEGIGWLENSSGVKVLLFYPYEIIDNERRLNKNGSYANIYPQYVLKLKKGSMPGVFGRASGGPGVPKKIDQVAINVDLLTSSFQRTSTSSRAPLPYTLKERIARTVAHELSHGMSVWHHGSEDTLPDVTVPDSMPPYRILMNDGSEVSPRPNRLINIGESGNAASGDLSCFMCYTYQFDYAYKGIFNGSPLYYSFPKLPVGRLMCTSKAGTGLNAANNIGINNKQKYFADADPGDSRRGDCFGHVKLKE